MPNHNTVRLGKAAPVHDPRTLLFSKYALAQEAETALHTPHGTNWLAMETSWNMYGNNVLGDCVEAAAAHMVCVWNSWNQPAHLPPTTAQVIEAYSAVGGYVPGNPSTDNGTSMLAFLKYWRSVGIAGNKILGFCALTPGNIHELRQAIFLFGAAFVGLQMPLTAQDETQWAIVENGGPDAQPGSWGGHCVPAARYKKRRGGGPHGNSHVVSWGAIYGMNDEFYRRCNDESYAVLSAEWLNGTTGRAPNNFDLAQFEADLAAI